MSELDPTGARDLLHRYRFNGGRLRRIRLVNRNARRADASIDLWVRTTSTGRAVRVTLLIEGVEEFRFQRRPGAALVRLREVRVGFFDGMVYWNFDAFAEDGPAKVVDFRASDAFIAGRRCEVTVHEPPTKS